MFEFDHDADHDAPTGSELLAEVGLDPRAIREIIEDDRAIRCPDRDQVLPDRGTAFLDVAMPYGSALHGAASAETPGPNLARRPA